MSDGMSGWSVTSVSINGFTYFIQKNLEGWLVYRAYPANQNSLNPTENVVVYYWQAPLKYLGNRVRQQNFKNSEFLLASTTKILWQSGKAAKYKMKHIATGRHH